MAINMAKVKAIRYELDCDYRRFTAYVCCSKTIMIDEDGAVEVLSFSGRFTDCDIVKRQVETIELVYSRDVKLVILPTGHVVPLP